MIKDNPKKNLGLIILTRKCKERFQIPENLNHYSESDYKKAERKFIKYVLTDQGA